MHNLEVWTMALSKEREIDHGQRRLEESRQVQAAIEQLVRPEREGRGGVLQRVWHVANGVRHCRWIGSGLRRGERELCVTAANALDLAVRS